jgi:hypothetical protein
VPSNDKKQPAKKKSTGTSKAQGSGKAQSSKTASSENRDPVKARQAVAESAGHHPANVAKTRGANTIITDVEASVPLVIAPGARSPVDDIIEVLKREVIGQERAIEAICRALLKIDCSEYAESHAIARGLQPVPVAPQSAWFPDILKGSGFGVGNREAGGGTVSDRAWAIATARTPGASAPP